MTGIHQHTVHSQLQFVRLGQVWVCLDQVRLERPNLTYPNLIQPNLKQLIFKFSNIQKKVPFQAQCRFQTVLHTCCTVVVFVVPGSVILASVAFYVMLHPKYSKILDSNILYVDSRSSFCRCARILLCLGGFSFLVCLFLSYVSTFQDLSIPRLVSFPWFCPF